MSPFPPIPSVRADVVPMLALLAFFVIAPASPAAEKPVLTVLTWSEYLDPEVARAFERHADARLRFVYFETDDMRTRMMSDSQGTGYDVVLINGLVAEVYARHGWIAPLELEKIPNITNLEPRWRDAFPSTLTHAVPYFWGTLGIGYRSDLVSEPIASWRAIFEPGDALKGRILMLDSNRDLVGMALKALGHSVNSQDEGALKAAEALLKAQKPYVHSYGYMELSEASPLVRGDVAAAMMFNGDALMLQQHNPNVAYVVPEEGGNLWVDYFAIVGASQQAELAARFIDFLSRPDMAARNALFVNYATPNTAAAQHLPKSYFDDPVIYPDARVMERSEFYSRLAPRMQRTLNAMAAQIVQ